MDATLPSKRSNSALASDEYRSLLSRVDAIEQRYAAAERRVGRATDMSVLGAAVSTGALVSTGLLAAEALGGLDPAFLGRGAWPLVSAVAFLLASGAGLGVSFARRLARRRALLRPTSAE